MEMVAWGSRRQCPSPQGPLCSSVPQLKANGLGGPEGARGCRRCSAPRARLGLLEILSCLKAMTKAKGRDPSSLV